MVLEGGREIECDLCIWTGGFVVSLLARDAGLPVNERDQMLVDPFLRSVSHQEIYAIGEACAMRVQNARIVPMRVGYSSSLREMSTQQTTKGGHHLFV